MTEQDPKPRAPKSAKAADREARLSEALRVNLRRRKAQARERARAEGASDTGLPNAPAVHASRAKDPSKEG